ncbi:hypothetical protein RHSIM_Rhsim06G0099800 [Rhododendron simsii]|uniref:RING-type domain-containing protein n=1 Tax=Rhododendron simsii TaxID=118357 RepID=A0A834H455_RHOSS|nr:hypothetical protein RHSIM_Rhsim06G0099800 [Rhododendron simsii]
MEASTHDQEVFSCDPQERHCNGFEVVLRRYREIVPHLKFSQVTRSVDTTHGKVSPQEQNTVDAIIKASEYPLLIILVGFVNFTEIMSKNVDPLRKQTEFAPSALMEIPSQYKATLELSIMGRQTGNAPKWVPLPPPRYSVASTGNSSKPYNSSSFQKSTPPYQGYDTATGTAPYSSVDQVCHICLTNLKDMAFACGHQTCRDCGELVSSCPICRAPIRTRIRLY